MKPENVAHTRVALFTVMATFLLGCSNDMSDLENYAAEVRARKSIDIEPIPVITPYKAHIYEQAGRRDPFIPLNFIAPRQSSTGGIQPDFDRIREPLEEFPLDSMVMLGTITSKDTLFALVRAGDGIIHRITIGNHIGQNFGRIFGISETEINLIEIIPDGFGGFMEQEATLAMKQE